MKIFRVVISLLMLLAIVSLTACSTEAPPAPAPTATSEEEVSLLTDPEQATAEATQMPPTFTPTPSPQPTATHTPTPLPTPTPTSPATPTFTPTPEPVVKVLETLTDRINVRTGPGTGYPVVSVLEPGQEAVVTGRSEDESWWQIRLVDADGLEVLGWVYGQLVAFSGNNAVIPVAVAEAPPPSPAPAPDTGAVAEPQPVGDDDGDAPSTPEELADKLRCGQDFCVTYQAMVPIWENGGCIGNHSIYITVLQGLPPGKPMDGVVIGDTFNNVEVASGSHGPGRTEITLWSNSMTLIAKRHIDDTPYTSEESFNFTAQDELIPAEVLAANGYCEGSVEKCRWAQQHNQVCRGHYSWRVTFHKFD